MLLCTSSGRSSRRAWKTIPGDNAVLEITVIQELRAQLQELAAPLKALRKGFSEISAIALI